MKKFVLAVLGALVLFAGCDNPVISENGKTGTVSGNAVYENAASSEGITVKIEKVQGDKTASISFVKGRAVYSDGIVDVTSTDGSFKFEKVPEGLYRVYASSASAKEAAISDLVSVRAGENASLELSLKAVGSVKGKVTYGGECVSGIDVYIAGTSYIAKTDSNGNYEISGVPSGASYFITAEYKNSKKTSSKIEVEKDKAADAGTLDLVKQTNSENSSDEEILEGVSYKAAVKSGIFIRYRLPMYFSGSSAFYVEINNGDVTYQKSYSNIYTPQDEFIFPFVEPGKEYTFTVTCGYSYGGDRIYSDSFSITATGGLGDLEFENADKLKFGFAKNDGEDCIVKLDEFPVLKNDVINDILLEYTNKIDWCSTDRTKKTEFNFFKENSSSWYRASRSIGLLSGNKFDINCKAYISIPGVDGVFIKNIGTASGKNSGNVIKIRRYFRSEEISELTKNTVQLEFTGCPDYIDIPFGTIDYSCIPSYTISVPETSSEKRLADMIITEWGMYGKVTDSEKVEWKQVQTIYPYQSVSYCPVYSYGSYGSSDIGEICNEIIVYPSQFYIPGNVEIHRIDGSVENKTNVKICYTQSSRGDLYTILDNLSKSYVSDSSMRFVGWFSDKECTNRVDSEYILSTTGDLILYEGWEEQVVVGSLPLTSSDSLDYGDAEKFSFNPVTKTVTKKDSGYDSYKTGWTIDSIPDGAEMISITLQENNSNVLLCVGYSTEGYTGLGYFDNSTKREITLSRYSDLSTVYFMVYGGTSFGIEKADWIGYKMKTYN